VTRRRRPGVPAAAWGRPDLNAAGEPICRFCGAVVRPPRRTFCSASCVHEWRLRTDPSYVREQVFARDRGRCQHCGLDLRAAERRWRRAKPPARDRAARRRWYAARPRWEADHIVPVADGGGECGLDNYRLLCRACHVAVTTAWRRARRAAGLLDGGRAERTEAATPSGGATRESQGHDGLAGQAA
jgi:5-methylcytosine-specific restriction protein A